MYLQILDVPGCSYDIYSYLDYDLPSEVSYCALLVMRRNLRGVGLQYMIG